MNPLKPLPPGFLPDPPSVEEIRAAMEQGRRAAEAYRKVARQMRSGPPSPDALLRRIEAMEARLHALDNEDTQRLLMIAEDRSQVAALRRRLEELETRLASPPTRQKRPKRSKAS